MTGIPPASWQHFGNRSSGSSYSMDNPNSRNSGSQIAKAKSVKLRFAGASGNKNFLASESRKSLYLQGFPGFLFFIGYKLATAKKRARYGSEQSRSRWLQHGSSAGCNGSTDTRAGRGKSSGAEGPSFSCPILSISHYRKKRWFSKTERTAFCFA